MSAFSKTNLPDNVCEVRKIFEQAILMLPRLFKSPGGGYIEWVSVHCLQAGDFFSSREYVIDKVIIEPVLALQNEVLWATMLRDGSIYSSSIRLVPSDDSGMPEWDEEEWGAVELWGEGNIENEKDFINQVDNLVLQILLYLQTVPDALTEVKASSRGVGFRVNTKAPQFNPIWIGKNYKISRENNPASHSNHASRRLHWRRGHWSRRVIGKREEGNRKWTWIEPTLVGANSR